MPFPESQKHVGPKHSLVGVTQIALTLTLSCIKYDLQHLSDKYAAVSQDARASHLSAYHPVSSGYHIPAPPLCFLSVQLLKAAAPLSLLPPSMGSLRSMCCPTVCLKLEGWGQWHAPRLHITFPCLETKAAC